MAGTNNNNGTAVASRDRVRAPRLKTTKPLKVSGKTLGTNMIYKMETENLSRSGLLLSWKSAHRSPFVENTILELRIDADGTYFKTPVIALGRVVRKTSNVDEKNMRFDEYGVSIVQMENGDLDQWENWISFICTDVETAEVVSPEAPLRKFKDFRYG